MKRLLVAAVAVVLLSGCNTTDDPDTEGYRRPPLPPGTLSTGRPVAPPPTTPSQTPPPTCPPEGVLLESGETDGAAGLRALGITLTNCGHQDYKVDGYPVIQLLDKDHQRVTVKVLHKTATIAGPIPGWDDPPGPVTIKPGRQADCVVVWRSTYDDIRHPPVNAPYLVMAPATGRPAQTLTPRGPLDLGSTGRLAVTPWTLSKTVPATTPAAPPPTTQPSLPSSIL